MGSKQFTLGVIIRVVCLLATTVAIAALLLYKPLVFTLGFLVILLLGQTFNLIHFTNSSNRELQKFLEAVSYGDYSVNFKNQKLGKSFKDLFQQFDEIIAKLKAAEAEKQSQTELLKLIFENIKLGIVVVDERENIHVMNQHAQQLLGIPQFSTWKLLAKNKPEFAAALGNFNFEGRKLINLGKDHEQREYYLDLQHIQLLGERYFMLSFSDLKSEIEQKEIEAWHKLIRILAHEVMNSVTPVTSLSETLRGMLLTADRKVKKPQDLDEETIEDMVEALNTIVKRSRGMLGFVEEYRKLTKLPAPNYETIEIQQLFSDCKRLMAQEAQTRNVKITCTVKPPKLALKADRKMIEQCLINLMSNALYAMEDIEAEKILTLSANYRSDFTELCVNDTGKGIPDEVLSSIFIPFFSTRKNGSGIGLTLIKNIMKQHKGDVLVESKVNEGSTFKMRFTN